MKCSKGGISGDFIMEMSTVDFMEALDAAEELEAEIAKAMQGK